MRFPLYGLVRLLAFVAVGVCLLAVTLARLAPSPEAQRLFALPRYEVLRRASFTTPQSAPRYLDLRTGALHELPLPAEDCLDHAVCSPWIDAQGGFEVVGRWKSRSLGKAVGIMQPEAFGLARYGVPGGAVIDRVTLDVLPAGPPCWYPGTAARVLFAGGDGALYSFDFDASARHPSAPSQATRLTWRCNPPGPALILSDPIWPRDPWLGGRLIVSVQYQADATDARTGPSRLWWLALSADGLSIVDAAPLIPTDRTTAVDDESGDERYPSLAVVPGVGPALAYLWRARAMESWSLRLAPIQIDAATHAPFIVRNSARTLHAHHVPARPMVSSDGHWIFGLVAAEHAPGSGSIVRLSTTPPTTTPLAVEFLTPTASLASPLHAR